MKFDAELLYTALLAIFSKGVGSVFRIKDDWNAPPEIKRNTINRELCTLGQVGLFAVMLENLIFKRLPYLQTRFQRFVIKVFAVTIPSTIAEVLSRAYAPRNAPWNKTGKSPPRPPTTTTYSTQQNTQSSKPFYRPPPQTFPPLYSQPKAQYPYGIYTYYPSALTYYPNLINKW